MQYQKEGLCKENKKAWNMPLGKLHPIIVIIDSYPRPILQITSNTSSGCLAKFSSLSFFNSLLNMEKNNNKVWFHYFYFCVWERGKKKSYFLHNMITIDSANVYNINHCGYKLNKQSPKIILITTY